MANRENYYCLILAGGYSNNFWPLTRDSRPKQFAQLPNSQLSFLRETYNRCLQIVEPQNILVMALEKYAPLVREQLPMLRSENLLLEPYARNTAVCIAYASSVLLKRNPKAVMMVSPSDLLISEDKAFTQTLTRSLSYAEESDILITLGVRPHRADPNFGYIQFAGGKTPLMKDKLIKVKTFTEKPDIEIAEAFCRSGEFYWNSGIFVWKASVIYEEMEKYIPEVISLFKEARHLIDRVQEKEFIRKIYTDCDSMSIDYAVMEKTDRAWIFPVDFGWSDIENWDSLYEFYDKKDKEDNILFVDKHVNNKSRKNIVVEQNSSKLVSISGLENYIVIDTPDVLMICPREDKEYKSLLAKLNTSDLKEFK